MTRFSGGRYAWSCALWSPTWASVVSQWSDECEFELGHDPTQALAMRHQNRCADGSTVPPRRWLKDVDEHLQFVTQCSPCGSISHSHGGQGA